MTERSLFRASRLAALLALLAAAGGCLLPDSALVALFTAHPTQGRSPLDVTFDASASYAEDAAVIAYDWAFGDGENGVGVATAHRYTTDVERIYTVTLTVTDSAARQAQETHTVTVSPPEPAPPSPTIEFIWPFHYDAYGEDAANLNDEYFTLENTGTETVDLTGWSVSNEGGDTFRFPDGFTLAPGAIVMIHSGAGSDSAEILYWDAAEPVWNNTTDIAILYDAGGDIVDVYAYASC